ncbi:ser/Thr protein phosphatase superfamily [Pseudovirgaria hyperparasitica]|uniref:Ser/Thr protein phosphatase superfamily n=1 Tax=Pseudovirgaria hyperparasitica TaxID=470096 RepID=A0A6A6W9M1_9PEZI|nr:ser/Thr protein phosphatase superfamily [Pseudovirgaria hyperparasitica]KAF2759373.1 ser/Thr protein phosphatase superfamily [Pseudovirgaria hyperparasitica]
MNKLLRYLLPKSLSPTFQVVSDLHLEIGQQYSTYNIISQAPYLILGGDIGRLIDYEPYLEFLKVHKARFEKIFLVLGNHEFYGLSYAAGLEQAQKLQDEPILDCKLVILHQACFDVPNSAVTILGCTLWSKIPEESMQVVQSRVKDFQKICDWTVEDHNKAFESDYTWLKRAVSSMNETNPVSSQRSRTRTALVVTHHAPSMCGTSHPNHEQNPWSSAFATDLISDREAWRNVGVWIFGHTHYTTDFVRSGVRLFSNQRGYVLPGSIETTRSSKSRQTKPRVFDVRKTLRV